MTPLPQCHRVLIADDEETLRFVLRELLQHCGCDVDEAADGAEAVELARKSPYDLYLLDMKMPRLDGLAALREIRSIHRDALAVMITAFGSQQLAIDAIKAGAYDYFTKPFNVEELRMVLMRALEKQTLQRQLNELRERVDGAVRLGRLIGGSPVTQQVFRLIAQVAEHDVTVLIAGESGTGKELVAEAIHDSSARRKGPLVKVNCAAIPEPLLESELFGHERGAFTGAVSAKPGRFELAGGGTLFLDEIGEMPLSLQSKLLRVLQERTVDRVGGGKPRNLDIRVLAATNRDLQSMVAAGSFREDLFYRLNVFPVKLPPLRERMSDLPALVQHFLVEFNGRFGKRVEGLTPEAMALLERHDWPGNIRELENVLQRAMVLTAGPMIGRDALPELCRLATASNGNGHHPNGNGSGRHASAPEDFSVPLARRIEGVIEEEEKRIILAALEKMGGRRQETADLLGISRKSLHNKMLKYEMFDRGADE